MKSVYEAVVVGAGPAGCSAAIHLKQLDIDVLLIDKSTFPRDKICGDGISSKCFSLLNELGIKSDFLFDKGYPIAQMQIHAPNSEIIRYGDDHDKFNAKSICMPRKDFDFLLLSRAKEVVKNIALGEKLVTIEKDANSRHALFLKNVETNELKRIKTKIIIGADGVYSAVSRHVGIITETDDNRMWGIRLYCEGKDFEPVIHIIYHRNILPGYAWIFPVSKNNANVGMLLTLETMKSIGKDIVNIFEEVISEHPVFRENIGLNDGLGSIRAFPLKVGPAKGSRVEDGIILAGDAAYFTNPLTGGGIYNAILSGKLAAKVSCECIKKNDISSRALKKYDSLWRKRISSNFFYSNLMKKLLKNEMTTSCLLRSCSKKRVSANLFMAMYGNPLPRFAFINPLFWGKMIMG
jgi:geranylgeranyl reductase family protein